MPSLKKRDRQTKGKLLCSPPPPPSTAIVRHRHATTPPPPPAANMAEREMYINEKLSVPAICSFERESGKLRRQAADGANGIL